MTHKTPQELEKTGWGCPREKHQEEGSAVPGGEGRLLAAKQRYGNIRATENTTCSTWGLLHKPSTHPVPARSFMEFLRP